MARKQQEQEPIAQEKQEPRQLNSVIGRHVMRDLGLPENLLRIQVRHLWGDRYRVNVLIGANAVSAEVAHSYFLVADGEGNIVSSTPNITKHYPSTAAEGTPLAVSTNTPAL